jgi:hypothetical protein
MTRHTLNASVRVLPRGDAEFSRPVQSRWASEQDRRATDGPVAAAMVNNHAVEYAESGAPFVEVIF